MCSFIKKRVGLFKNQKGFKWGFWNQRGFSLVELMVVAIIGILASIAIPNYQKFRRKAQQSSAKSALSGIFTAERVFSTEWAFGGTSFEQIGYEQEGTNFYNVGWKTDATSGQWNATNHADANVQALYKGPQATGTVTDFKTGGSLGGAIALDHNGFKSCPDVTGTGSCSGLTCTLVSGTCTISTVTANCSCPAVVNNLIVPGNGTTRTSVDTFTIGAAANLGAIEDDLWTMDQSKNLVNVQSGL